MKKKVEKNIEVIPVATLRDGSILTIGDEVETDYHPKCAGVVFVVSEINSNVGACESGSLIVAHVKGYPERKIKSFSDKGIDTNWFKKVKQI